MGQFKSQRSQAISISENQVPWAFLVDKYLNNVYLSKQKQEDSN